MQNKSKYIIYKIKRKIFYLEKNNKNNIIALIYNIYDMNNKININITNKINKEEKNIKFLLKKYSYVIVLKI